jgi:hypothetical protein
MLNDPRKQMLNENEIAFGQICEWNGRGYPLSGFKSAPYMFGLTLQDQTLLAHELYGV